MTESRNPVSLNADGTYYVLASGSVVHVAYVFNNLNAMNQMLRRPLEPCNSIGTFEVYSKYIETLKDFSVSPESKRTYYGYGTLVDVRTALDACIGSGKRIRIWYGNALTGESTLDEYEVTGTVGRSTGTMKVPLLSNNRRSTGGAAILTSIVVRIDDIASKRTLFKHPMFNVQEMAIRHSTELRKFEVYNPHTSVVLSRFVSEKRAQNWIDFHNGKRYRA